MTDNSLSELRKHLKTTAYARYHAARRYAKLNNTSLFSLTTSSFSSIFITILDKYSSPNLFAPDTLAMLQLLCSIFVASLSLVVSFAAYSTKSERMFISGNNINSLVSDVDLELKIENDKRLIYIERQIRDSYKQLKLQCENHSNIDYYFGRIERKKEEKDTQDTKESLILINHIGYWAPLFLFWSISSLSLLVFGYSLYKYFIGN